MILQAIHEIMVVNTLKKNKKKKIPLSPQSFNRFGSSYSFIFKTKFVNSSHGQVSLERITLLKPLGFIISTHAILKS